MSKLELDHKIIREILKDDPEFYVEVKQAILQSAIQHDTRRFMDQMSRDYLRQVIKVEIASYEGEPGKVPTYTPTQRMRLQVQSAILDDIRNMVKEEFKNHEEYFKDFAGSIINANAAKLIDAEVNKRLSLAMASVNTGTYPDITKDS